MKIPKLNELYPDLFEKEKVVVEDWRVIKEKMMDYTENHNKKRKRGDKG